jgi:hypothetical protein
LTLNTASWVHFTVWEILSEQIIFCSIMCDVAYVLQTVDATIQGLARLSPTAQEPSPVHWYISWACCLWLEVDVGDYTREPWDFNYSKLYCTNWEAFTRMRVNSDCHFYVVVCFH